VYLLTFCPPGPLLRLNVTLHRSLGSCAGVKFFMNKCNVFISSSRAENLVFRVGFDLSILA
jgi:hypothetical protein